MFTRMSALTPIVYDPFFRTSLKQSFTAFALPCSPSLLVTSMIDKWLKAGVLEQGPLSYPTTGTPQRGVISPALSNVFLHHVLDEWFAEQVQPRLRGSSALVGYCDDFVMLFAHKGNAERVQAVLGKRLAKFGLELHPDKTRLTCGRH